MGVPARTKRLIEKLDLNPRINLDEIGGAL
jgi:hypothetical protein